MLNRPILSLSFNLKYKYQQQMRAKKVVVGRRHGFTSTCGRSSPPSARHTWHAGSRVAIWFKTKPWVVADPSITCAGIRLMQDIVDEKIVIVQIYSNIEMSGFKVLVVNIKLKLDNLLAIIMQIYFSLGTEMWMRFLD